MKHILLALLIIGSNACGQITISRPSTTLAGDGIAISNALTSGLFTPTTTLRLDHLFGTGKANTYNLLDAMSGWAEGVGVVPIAFNTIEIGIYPSSGSYLPANVLVEIREQGTSWGSWNSYSVITWPIVASGTLTIPASSLSVGVLYKATIPLNVTLSTTSKLFVAVRTDGRVGFNKVTVPIDNFTAPGGIAPPSYITSRSVTPNEDNSWNASDISYQFYIGFGSAQTVDAWNFSSSALSAIANVALSYTNSVAISMAETNYAVEGTEFNLYFRNAVRTPFDIASGPYWPRVICPINGGIQYNDRFSIPASSNVAGTTTLKLDVLMETNVAKTQTTVFKTAANSAGNGITRKLLMIGDSTGDAPIAELTRMAGTNGFLLIATGTQGTGTNLNEAYSGKTATWFYSDAASPFVKAGTFNFAAYLTDHSISLSSQDWVIIHLGINDIMNRHTDSEALVEAAAFVNTVSNMVNKSTIGIAAAVPGIRVGLCLTIPPSYTQDAFGISETTTMSSGHDHTAWTYTRARYFLAEAIMAMPHTWAAIVPINTCLDTVNNMNTTTIAANSRNATVITVQNNSVHPATSGAEQISDQIWAFLKCNE